METSTNRGDAFSQQPSFRHHALWSASTKKSGEGHCILAKKQSPIQIGNIEHYISDYYLNVLDPQREEAHNHRVAIIGSGPAGLSLAFFLVLKGYGVTIFEANEDIGGVLRYGIPSFRLPKDILDRMRERLREMGVKIRPNVLIGSIGRWTNCSGTDSTPSSSERASGIRTSSTSRGNVSGTSRMRSISCALGRFRPRVVRHRDRAGNSAMDTARTALRQGARSVRILYHRGPEDIPARDQEVQYARIDGVKFEFYRKALEITEKGIDCEILGRPEGAEKDPDGEPGEHVFLDADTIIVCISQGPR
jgi:glutamate synthase (NADPH/NADH) small chain